MLLRFSSTIIISITSFSPFSTNYRINDTKLRTTTIPNKMPGSLNSNDPDNMRNCLPHGESAIAALSVAFVFLLAAVGYLAYKSHHTKSTMVRLRSKIRRLEGGELREKDRRLSMNAKTTATAPAE